MSLDTRCADRAGISGFVAEEAGATAIEYSLIAAMFAIVCIAGWNALGSALNGKFTFIATTVNGAIN